MAQHYSIPTETERDILNIVDALRDLLDNGVLDRFIEKSSLTQSDFSCAIDLLESYGYTLPGED